MRKSSIAGYTDLELVELWGERSAVGEFDGGLLREEAESRAAREIQRSLPKRKMPHKIQKALLRS